MVDFNFSGAVDRNNSISAVASSMNSKSVDLLNISMEMSGKQIAKVGSESYALDKMDAAAVKTLAVASATLTAAQKESLSALFGVNQNDCSSVSGSITVTSGAPTLTLTFTNKNTDVTTTLSATLDTSGKVTKFSSATGATAGTLLDVNSTGLLDSWGISGTDLSPGDLYLVQQHLQVIKDAISTIQASGKSQGDVMREVTQKFAQG